jgi:hypothetical protein
VWEYPFMYLLLCFKGERKDKISKDVRMLFSQVVGCRSLVLKFGSSLELLNQTLGLSSVQVQFGGNAESLVLGSVERLVLLNLFEPGLNLELLGKYCNLCIC